MEHLHCQRELNWLTLFSRTSFDQLTRDLFFLESRQYADNTLRAVIGALDPFTRRLPADRRRVIAGDLTATTSADIDSFLAAARAKRLSPRSTRCAPDLGARAASIDFLYCRL